ncbi:hypothetical protein [Hamadaea tsunoensis]|uniref:hypothetical protein n=1 Tax=Hamadaea tsunoensis TaxID=53368 RepID=UPI000423C70D|nr:hypothetical protein [Hamadaea tsunoensis]
MRITRWKAVLVALVAAAASVSVAEPSWAETNPNCGSVTQIGSTAYIVIGGATFGSVKQFKGCSKNWGYVYVWESWRNAHTNWDMCAAVGVIEGSPPYALEGLNCSYNTRKAEQWSYGTNTLSVCTRAVGAFPDKVTAQTDVRC